jgi:3-phytase
MKTASFIKELAMGRKFMTPLKTWLLVVLLLAGATSAHTWSQALKAGDKIQPVLATEKSRYDTDDPAIWVNRKQAGKSLILGTDKNQDGALYVYDLDGNIQQDKIVRHLQSPNNVDVEYGFSLGGEAVDIAVVTERGTEKLRIFKLPEMQPIDGGGVKVFSGEPTPNFRSPMGIALYKRPEDGAVFAIVGRKKGPAVGYLWQYRLEDDGRGRIRGELVRKFGAFSGNKEIEAIAVDDALGYVYYSDEKTGIRKYHADPRKGPEELALFGTEDFVKEREGIAIYPIDESRGYILVSDQQGNRFHVYRREGEPGQPHRHQLLKTIRTSARETDGCEASSFPLNARFPHGLFIAMSNNKTFQYYRWEDLAGDDLELKGPGPGRFSRVKNDLKDAPPRI